MKQGFVLPGGSAPEQLELAVLAEGVGWDAVFVWEGGYAVDAWSLLSAIAVRTERIRLGTMLTPLPWRRPWKLAAQVATLDQLSSGRAILAVGLGAIDTGLGSYPEIADKRSRGTLLDDGLEVVRGLWEGTRTFDTPSWKLDLSTAAMRGPQPVQDRIPIWCVGALGRPRSMRRIERCDGLLPTLVDAGDPMGSRQPTPDELRAALPTFSRPGLDIVVEGETAPGDTSALDVWRDIATWWLESRWSADSPAAVRERIAAGPL